MYLTRQIQNLFPNHALGKGINHFFSLQLWVNCWSNCVSSYGKATGQKEGKYFEFKLGERLASNSILQKRTGCGSDPILPRVREIFTLQLDLTANTWCVSLIEWKNSERSQGWISLYKCVPIGVDCIILKEELFEDLIAPNFCNWQRSVCCKRQRTSDC